MNDDWTNITGINGWKEKLQELIQAAESAARENDARQIAEVSDRLVAFIINSTPDDSTAIREMDRIAKKTRNDLIKGAIEERLAGIAERTGELAVLDAEIRSIARESEENAASIRLEKAQNVVKSLTDTVGTLKDFKSSLKTGTDVEVAQSLEQIILQIQTLRSQIEGIT